MKSTRLWLLGIVLLALSASAGAEELATIKLAAKDGKFEPATLAVPAGKRFKLEVSNEGKSAIEFESKQLRQEKVIPAGGKATFTLNALKPGEYGFVDEYKEATAKGKLVAK